MFCRENRERGGESGGGERRGRGETRGGQRLPGGGVDRSLGHYPQQRASVFTSLHSSLLTISSTETAQSSLAEALRLSQPRTEGSPARHTDPHNLKERKCHHYSCRNTSKPNKQANKRMSPVRSPLSVSSSQRRRGRKALHLREGPPGLRAPTWVQHSPPGVSLVSYHLRKHF